MKLTHFKPIVEARKPDAEIPDAFDTNDEYLEYLETKAASLVRQKESIAQQLQLIQKSGVFITDWNDSTYFDKQGRIKAPYNKDYVPMPIPLNPKYQADFYDTHKHFMLQKSQQHLMPKLMRFIVLDRDLPKIADGLLEKAKHFRKMYTNKRMEELAKQASKPIDPANVPQRFTYAKGKTFENPYFKSKPSTRYAGHPTGYPDLSGPMRLMYVKLNDALEKIGHEGITTLYGGRINGHINILGIGAGGKFLWRKYQTAGADGQNWVYMNGHKQQTSHIMDDPAGDILSAIGYGPNAV